jgi:hypothetical protein
MTAKDSKTRRKCPTDRKRWLLNHQRFVCAYCAIPFGSVVLRRGRLSLTSVHFDHFVPHAYLNNNPVGNWVAACNVCNSIKSSLMFDSVEQAAYHITTMWLVKKYSIQWLAPVSSEEDPERWAVKFSGYLASMPPRLAGSITYVKPFTKVRSERAA